jgi:predicted RNase H-like HicB family nuclease
MKEIPIPLPVYMAKENEWFVASCPVLDIATQGMTEEEVKKNLEDLINEYLNDPDTPKPEIKTIMSVSLTNIPVNIPEGVLYRKTQTSSKK